MKIENKNLVIEVVEKLCRFDFISVQKFNFSETFNSACKNNGLRSRFGSKWMFFEILKTCKNENSVFSRGFEISKEFWFRKYKLDFSTALNFENVKILMFG